MKVAVVFNEPYKELIDPYAIKCTPEFCNNDVFKLRGCDIIAEYELIAKNLRLFGYDSYILNILDNLDVLLNDLNINKPDIIFNLIEIYKDKAGLEKNFASVFELMKIPFTGATSKSLALCQNKYLSKQILSENNILVPSFQNVNSINNNFLLKVNFPIIVKPVSEDGSIGIDDDSVINDYDNLITKISELHNRFKQPVIIEEFIDGREINVSLLEIDEIVVLPISEIDFSNMPSNYNKIVGFNAKWNSEHECYKKTIPVCPANLIPEIEVKAKEIAIKCFSVLNCRGYARVDMRIDKNGNIFVLEVNPNPDLSIDAGFFRAAKVHGYSYNKLLEIIVKNAKTKA
ncbi:MAG TPA: ATP-grasp domain-containing protein [Melioribacteraceae bacterium]|nr:ATP-grasp domain-containing protein [Melioribacteraceae bacterium]